MNTASMTEVKSLLGLNRLKSGNLRAATTSVVRNTGALEGRHEGRVSGLAECSQEPGGFPAAPRPGPAACHGWGDVRLD